ncbi:MAG TPA: tetratricopeptide repeat protein [Vicinamibacterales bacterium]|nr:tetratricopeptide repeat protein [Vicinamibacterales bacterium]
MSVVLDALRRARKAPGAGRSDTAPPAARPVPAGLGLGASSLPAPTVRPARTRWLGLGALLVIGLGVWAAIEVTRDLVSPAAPAQSTQAPQATDYRPLPRAVPQTTAPPASIASDPEATNAPSAATAPRIDAEPRRSTPPRSAAQRPAPRTPSPDSRIPSPESGVPNPESRIPSADINHFELAVRYHNLGDFDQALKHYLAVLAADEFNIEARNNLGLLYHRRGMTTEALDQFRRAIAITPQYLKARSNLAVVLMDAGRLAEARAELRAAMTIEPRNVDLLVNMALVEKADRHPDQAVELLVKAIGYRPTHSAAHYNIAVLYEERASLALAYDHYTEFLKYAGPEHGALLSDVQRRILLLKPKLDTAER